MAECLAFEGASPLRGNGGQSACVKLYRFVSSAIVLGQSLLSVHSSDNRRLTTQCPFPFSDWLGCFTIS
ncbi:hypothetical protein BGLA2_1510006 [Burkholderia gladioli]|nr:hypothetical protein BGLA2_1510006 [Burkholderia gladioli]